MVGALSGLQIRSTQEVFIHRVTPIMDMEFDDRVRKYAADPSTKRPKETSVSMRR